MMCMLKVSEATFTNNKLSVFILFPLGNIFCVIWLTDTRIVCAYVCIQVHTHNYPQAEMQINC